jgi:FMN-dependent NADH-azoreductase
MKLLHVDPSALVPDIAAGQAALDQFLAAAVVVVGMPMENFTLNTKHLLPP